MLITTFFSEVQPLNAASPILFVAFGTFISVIDEQFSKAFAPISVTPTGISTFIILQFRNALAPINVALEGILNVSRAEQPLKELTPRYSVSSGMTASVRELNP